MPSTLSSGRNGSSGRDNVKKMRDEKKRKVKKGIEEGGSKGDRQGGEGINSYACHASNMRTLRRRS